MVATCLLPVLLGDETWEGDRLRHTARRAKLIMGISIKAAQGPGGRACAAKKTLTVVPTGLLYFYVRKRLFDLDKVTYIVT